LKELITKKLPFQTISAQIQLILRALHKICFFCEGGMAFDNYTPQTGLE
jgi:hypothetical protein